MFYLDWVLVVLTFCWMKWKPRGLSYIVNSVLIWSCYVRCCLWCLCGWDWKGHNSVCPYSLLWLLQEAEGDFMIGLLWFPYYHPLVFTQDNLCKTRGVHTCFLADQAWLFVVCNSSGDRWGRTKTNAFWWIRVQLVFSDIRGLCAAFFVSWVPPDCLSNIFHL